MSKKITIILIILAIIFIAKNQWSKEDISGIVSQTNIDNEDSNIFAEIHPLTIESLRNGNYPGSEVTIEETLDPGSNYKRYIASYISEGNKIYGLLTVPIGQRPTSGWPAIVFNHGYIPPTQYKPTEKYVAYVDGFARNGYVVFKPDYRGHGESEGEAVGAYGSNAYTIDVLNAVASVKKLKDPSTSSGQALSVTSKQIVDQNRIGMWGHSLGGHLTLRSMVSNKDIKAGVIWAGVIGSYPDLLNNWRRRTSSPPPLPSGARRWRQALVEVFGIPESNPQFWNSISATSYLEDISGPLQLHHGTADASVPIEFSQKVHDQLEELDKEVELFTYPGDDHNLSQNFSLAIKRSVDFFAKYLK